MGVSNVANPKLLNARTVMDAYPFRNADNGNW